MEDKNDSGVIQERLLSVEAGARDGKGVEVNKQKVLRRIYL